MHEPWKIAEQIQWKHILLLSYLPLLLTIVLALVVMFAALLGSSSVGPMFFVSSVLGYTLSTLLLGFMVGAANVPVLVICVRRKHLHHALPIIYGATLAATIWYLLSPLEWGSAYYPLPSAIVAIVVVHVMALLCRWILPDDRRVRGLMTCPGCGYDLRGDRSAGCPECGWGRGGGKNVER